MAPVEVVRHLLGVQAQVLSAAGLALGARTDGLTSESVERARLEERSIVLAWMMRGTLHLVAAEDYAWLQPLVVEPRIANSQRRLRELGLAADQVTRATRAIERMLERDGPLGRGQIMERLRRQRVPAQVPAVGVHLLWLAESTGRVCHGPVRDRERCFVLVRDWIGNPTPMDRDAALAELAARYLAAHGPASPADLASWSGLRARDAGRAWRAVEDRLVEVRAPGTTLWALGSLREEAPPRTVRLLPNFDEYLLGWKDRAFVAEPEQWKRVNKGGGWLHPVVLVDGRAVGTWKGERTPRRFSARVSPFGSLSARVRTQVSAEARRLGEFVGTAAEVSLDSQGQAT
jgi:hypothetical protein